MARPPGRRARALTAKAMVRDGVELAGVVGSTAAEVLRTRRDPVLVAQRRRQAAVRRLRIWSAGAVVTAPLAAVQVVGLVNQGVQLGVLVAVIFLVAAFLWCVVEIARSAADLRARSRALAKLPAAAPPRPAVGGTARREIAPLNEYSTSLRRLVGLVGMTDDTGLAELRAGVLRSADDVERRLRERARELGDVVRSRRSAPPEGREVLDDTVDALRRELRDGVAGYAELVAAAGDAASATRELRAHAAASSVLAVPARPAVPARSAGSATERRPDELPPTAGRRLPGRRGAGSGPSPSGSPDPAVTPLRHELADSVDRLHSLAAGMRELTRG